MESAMLFTYVVLKSFCKAYTHPWDVCLKWKSYMGITRIWKSLLLGRHVFPFCLRVPEAPWLQTWLLFLGSIARIHMAAELHLGKRSAIPQSAWKVQIAQRQMQAALSWNNMKKQLSNDKIMIGLKQVHFWQCPSSGVAIKLLAPAAT